MGMDILRDYISLKSEIFQFSLATYVIIVEVINLSPSQTFALIFAKWRKQGKSMEPHFNPFRVPRAEKNNAHA